MLIQVRHSIAEASVMMLIDFIYGTAFDAIVISSRPMLLS